MSKRAQIFSTGPELTIGVIVECATGPPILVCAQLVGDTEEALRGKVTCTPEFCSPGSIHLETTVGKTVVWYHTGKTARAPALGTD